VGDAVTKTGQGPRRNRDQAIVAAAIQVFSEKGYAAASLQDVADSVGLLKGSLYHYISAKESLLYRIFQESYEQALALRAGVDALGLSPEARLREFIRQLTLFYAQNRERASLYFTEWRHLTGEDYKTVMRQRREFEVYVTDLIQDVAKQGLARDGLDVKLATRYLLTAVNGVVIWYRPGGTWSALVVAEQLADMTCAAVLKPPLTVDEKVTPTSKGARPSKATRPAKAAEAASAG
jgi:AcrR family transcriptional regulator